MERRRSLNTRQKVGIFEGDQYAWREQNTPRETLRKRRAAGKAAHRTAQKTPVSSEVDSAWDSLPPETREAILRLVGGAKEATDESAVGACKSRHSAG